MFYHTDHSWMISLQSDNADDYWESFCEWNPFHTESMWMVFLQCEFSCDESRCPWCLKLFPHWVHAKGLSPVWILMCTFSCPLSLKLFPHWVHVWGLSPVWIFMCLFRVDLHPKLFPHSEQVEDPSACFCVKFSFLLFEIPSSLVK